MNPNYLHMKKLTILVLTILSVSNIILSQPTRNSTLDDFYSKKMIETNLSGNHYDISNIMGSPYLNNDFQTGDILTTSNTYYDGISLRYNIYNDDMEYKGKDENIYSLEKSTITIVNIGDTEFIYKAYSNNGTIGRSFFEVLSKGKITLLKQYHVRFEQEQPAKAFADPVPAKFNSTRSDYYILIGEHEPKRISNFKDMIELLPDQKSEIEKYIKSNKLKFGSQEDISKIIAYYNSDK